MEGEQDESAAGFSKFKPKAFVSGLNALVSPQFIADAANMETYGKINENCGTF